MLKITEMLSMPPTPLWRLVKQVGVDHVVTLLEGAEQQWRWPRPGDPLHLPSPYVPPPPGERPWEFRALQRLQHSYSEYGLDLAVVEDTAPMDAVRLGRPGRDEQIEWVCDQVRAMGRLGIGTLCYNWQAISGWSRTAADVTLRGGAVSTRFSAEEVRRHPLLVEPGSVSTDDLWSALEYFLNAVVPVAEEAGVRIGMHPDDPPLPEVRGIPRIASTVEDFERLLSIVDSPNSGITLCQGNFTLMTDDLPALIRRFGSRKRIFFVHFRDVAGHREDFVEVFQDEGPTDMFECMRAYAEVGFDGWLRPDHVPALEGETNSSYGYETLGRLFAIGYITGLREAAYGKEPSHWGRQRPPEGWPLCEHTSRSAQEG